MACTSMNLVDGLRANDKTTRNNGTFIHGDVGQKLPKHFHEQYFHFLLFDG